MRKALTIQKEDKRFDGFPDFEKLRELGMEYIAGFSGDIWTDHNAHDPGITMLEVLCYALTDLGYRTSLAVPELLAPDPKAGETQDNFFTPEEILTNNPLTVLDYRRLLVDIEGVRNAWIVPATEQEIALGHRCTPDSLHIADPRESTPAQVACSENQNPEDFNHTDVKINGLYRVLLDLETSARADRQPCEDDEVNTGAILDEVYYRLHRHRNLCEDFIDIVVLKDEEIGICADLELDSTAQPDVVLQGVYEAVEKFISPRLKFYSLREMLDRGHPIEDIYRGRPFTPAYETRHAGQHKFSHGFVEERQLLDSEYATEFFASDFYRVIMKVEGVRAIRSFSLSSYRGDVVQTEGEEWRLRLTAGHRPVFSPDRSSMKFYKGVIRVRVANPVGVRERFRKRLTDYQKTKYDRSDLDLAVPYGRYREDLGDYYSVQHEFPTVYGIGEGELSADAPPDRKVQALQLQGFLSFFDQLLADYLAQLANLRRLFALHSGATASTANTYFSQVVTNSPQLEKIARFYRPEEGVEQVVRLVRSSQLYSHPVERDQAVDSAIAQLRVMRLRDALERLAVAPAGHGYRFVLQDSRGRSWLEGATVFQQEQNARAAGEKALRILLFQGIVAENYERENRPANRCYRFYILDNPSSYANYLQQSVESPALFQQRRDYFLNHLLARFGEQFTDYVLLMFALNQESVDPKTIIRDKERFLANYPAISRNRGRAFDYTDTEELWDSADNLSGLETRVSHLMGIEDWRRRNLNPFSVQLRDPGVYLELRDHRGRLLLRTNASYETPERACTAATALYQALTGSAPFSAIDCPTESIYSYQLLDEAGKPWATGMRDFPTPVDRDDHLACLELYFREPLGLRAEVTEVSTGFGYRIVAEDRVEDGVTPVCLFINDEEYDTYDAAWQAASETLAALYGEKSPRLFNSPNSTAKGFGLRISTTDKLRDDGAIVSCCPEIYESKVGRQETKERIEAYLDGLLSSGVGIMARLSASGAGYFFQALGPDEASVYLTTPAAAESYADACREGLKLLAAARDRAHYVETAGGYSEGQYSFKVVDSDGTDTGEHPRGYPQDTARDLALGEVADYLVPRELDYDIRQDASKFYWQITLGEPAFTLFGSHAFTDAEAVRAAWQLTRSAAANPLQYRLTEAEDGGWFWELRREDSLVLAASNVFTDQDTARAARKSFVACLREEDSPAEIREETGGFYFVLCFEENDALIGTRRYPDAEAAECAFLHFTRPAGDAVHYREVSFGDDCRYSFAVWEAEERLAYHPRYCLPAEKADYQGRLIEHILLERNPFLIKKLAGDWQFTIYWDTCGGACEVLFEQTLPEEVDQIAAKQSLKVFLENTVLDDWEDLSSEEGYSWLAKAVNSNEQTIVAEHPRWYATPTERDAAKIDAQAYLGRYRKLSAEDEKLFTAVDRLNICGKQLRRGEPVATDCPHLQAYEPTGEGCVLSGFSLRKDEYPVAHHPVRYFSAAERDVAREALLSRARCGLYHYSELQLQGEKVIVKFGLRYYYEWWGTRPVVRRLWRSVASFESEAAAREAFERDRLELLAISKQVEAYRVATLTSERVRLSRDCRQEVAAELDQWHLDTLPQTARLVLYREEVPVLFVPEEETGITLREERIAFAQYYPVLLVDQEIYFHLLDPESEQPDWRSTEAFMNETEAWGAFRRFWRLLPRAENYLPRDKPGPCIFELNLVETLLVSDRTYADAVQVEVIAVAPEPIADIETAEAMLAELRALPLNEITREVIKDKQDDRRDYFELRRATDQRLLLRSPVSYANRVELSQNWLRLQQALSSAENLSVHPHPNAEGYQLIVSRTVLPGKSQQDTDSRRYYIEQAEYSAPEYPVSDDLCLPVVPLGAEPPAGRPLCPKAWNNGLEDFLIYGTKAENYYPFFDPGADCGYRFRVVTDRYRLARNPRESHTPAERECLLDWLYGYANCGFSGNCAEPGSDLAPVYQVTTFARDGRCYYRLLLPGNGKDHWDSYEAYDKEDVATEAYAQRTVELMSYAQEPDCYELIRASLSPDEEPRWYLGLIDAEGRRVLVSRACYGVSEIEAAVLERVKQARKYPFFYFRGSYGFQLFSTEDVPDCRHPLTSSCLPDKAEEGSSTALPVLDIGNIPTEIPGEVIWESIQDYDSLEEAICAYQHFLCLLRDRRNYQRIRLMDCNLFGLELTHPSEVLATHPQRHDSYAAVQQAIADTRACVNAEGLHLIEHILLRPKTDEDRLIPDNCPDCCNAEYLPPEQSTASACAPTDKTALSTSAASDPPPGTVVYVPGADPYSFWATVVLPYWPKRFQNINFRTFFEDTLRREAPAHVALRICWLDPKQMQRFEYHYRAWLEAQAIDGDCLEGDARAELIERLATITTVYPPAELQGEKCSGDGSEAGAVLLDSTQLS